MCTNKVPTAGPNGQVVYRPCGRCLECLRQYQQDWTIRLDEEFKAWDPGSVIFFTLTYRDDMLPLQVNFRHPVTLGFFQTFSRLGSFSSLDAHFRNLGLDSFFFTRSLRENTYEFRSDRRALCDSYLDIPNDKKPVIVVPTCSYVDLYTWLRYCRKYFSRHVEPLDYNGRKVSPYLKSLNWEYGDFPNSAYTPSFKYFLTTEYGPTTLRPHVHGVMMGVTEEMFRVFAKYWINTFGDGKSLDKTVSVKFSLYDPSKGGAMYIAKYCSKGSFDHPLVSRSVVYPSGKEFVSNSYLKCCQYFGVNEPFCVPPFRLMSKGIGIRYPFNKSIQDYWCVRCDGSTHFVTEDLKPMPITLKEYSDMFTYQKSRKVVSELLTGASDDFLDRRWSFVLSSHEVFKYDQKGKTIGHSFLTPVEDDHDIITFQNHIFNKKFVRCYVQDGVAKTYECLMPRYYRRFLLSPYSQYSLETAIHCFRESDYSRKRKFIESHRLEDSYETFLEQVSLGEALVDSHRKKDFALRRGKFYNRLFTGDLR